MDRTERLLRLIASLLDARELVSADTIRGWFPEDYGAASDDAFERKLERDKKEIVDLGIPLEWVPPGDDHDGGYRIDRDETYLRPIDFDSEELTALHIACTGVLTQSEFPYHRDLERALDKIALLAEPGEVDRARTAARRVLYNHPIQQNVPKMSTHLQAVTQAVDARKRVRMVYHTLYSGNITERTVDPYGMRCWRGRWAVIGYCHERDDIRLFSLHRIRELAVDTASLSTPDFDVPPDFSLAAWQMRPAWCYRLHEPVAARVEVDPERAWLVAGQLGEASGRGADGWVVFDVAVTNSDGFVEWALQQGPNVRVVAPDTLRDRVVATLRAVIEGAA